MFGADWSAVTFTLAFGRVVVGLIPSIARAFLVVLVPAIWRDNGAHRFLFLVRLRRVMGRWSSRTSPGVGSGGSCADGGGVVTVMVGVITPPPSMAA